jgi:hypothetical protein
MTEASQPGLFDRAPLAANADPVSSHITAREFASSGGRGQAKRKLLCFCVASANR